MENLRYSATNGCEGTYDVLYLPTKAMSGRYFSGCLTTPTKSVGSTSVSFTLSWVIFVALLARLDHGVWHRLALVVAETQDVQNVLDVSLTWCPHLP